MGDATGPLHLDDLMTDEDFVKAVEEMGEANEDADIGELLKAMNENRIISWEEAERILQDTSNEPIKSSLPEQTRPSEPDNDTDVEKAIQRLLDNDETLKEVNLNNMKRTPIPQVKRLIEALAYNEYCERLSLANMGLYDNDVATLLTVVEMNSALKKINLETNYLSGEFFAKLFKAACTNMTLEEIKCVNQGVSFATTAEKEIINAIVENKGLTKVSVNLRLPEGRHKIENATLRNGEYRRILRREAALKAKYEAEELAKNPVPKLPKETKTKKVAPKALPSKPCTTKTSATSLASPTIASAAKGRTKVEATDTKKAPAILPEKAAKPVPKKVVPEAKVEAETTKAPLRKTNSSHLARRRSTADPSATPVIPIATVDVKKAAEKLTSATKSTGKTGTKSKISAVDKTAEPEVKKPTRTKAAVKPNSETNSSAKKEEKPAAKPSEKAEEPTAPKKKKIVKKVIKKVPKKKVEETS